MKKIFAIIFSVLIVAIMIAGCTKDDSGILKDDEEAKDSTSVSADVGSESGDESPDSTSNTTSITTTSASTGPRSTGGNSWSKDYD